MHESWRAGDTDYEMQAYEDISKQYYYLGMLDKAAQYHKKMSRGSSDANDRPKGFETRVKINNAQMKLNDMENIPISKRIAEVVVTLIDGSTKIVLQPDHDYTSKNALIKPHFENFILRIQSDLDQFTALYKHDDEIEETLERIPDPISLYHQNPRKENLSFLTKEEN